HESEAYEPGPESRRDGTRRRRGEAGWHHVSPWSVSYPCGGWWYRSYLDGEGPAGTHGGPPRIADQSTAPRVRNPGCVVRDADRHRRRPGAGLASADVARHGPLLGLGDEDHRTR